MLTTNDAVVGRYLGYVMGSEASWLGSLQIHSGGTKPPIRLSAARHSTELRSPLPQAPNSGPSERLRGRHPRYRNPSPLAASPRGDSPQGARQRAGPPLQGPGRQGAWSRLWANAP